jgi:hypothetical protein
MSNVRTPDVVTVAVTRVDGGLTILRVVTAEFGPDGNGGRVANWTIVPTPEYIDGLIAQYVRDGAWTGGQLPVSWRIVPNDIVDENTDRTFRNAWKDDGGSKPGHDMAKAREIHRDRLRLLRAPLLDALDTEYLKADESGNQQDKKRIAARKQALRDVTADPAIEAAATPDELKAVLPEALRG